MILLWVLVIATVSIIWAFFSLKKEKQRHEMDEAKEEITKGRVVFHSSSAGESESSE